MSTETTKSKAWDWEQVTDKNEHYIKDIEYWEKPALEAYGFSKMCKDKSLREFLDLGCGLGRHSILFAQNGFNVSCCDLSQNSIDRTRQAMEKLGLKARYDVCDMLSLPYKPESFDCAMLYNVISHSDTNGVIKAVAALADILKTGALAYLTLCSKEAWGWKQDRVMLDENTKVMDEKGPEEGIPHFYADFNLINKLFLPQFDIKLNRLICEKNLGQTTQPAGKDEKWHHHLILEKKLGSCKIKPAESKTKE